ncbi:hypothetical protein [Wolbachia endosymbiont (group A) of Agelastica alni]|uniref:hypothetical protein n=1 Tax=Wolbachia endosymbiont (group A) of Agelastica alni TaxID=3066130 RepID=UPI0031329D2B
MKTSKRKNSNFQKKEDTSNDITHYIFVSTEDHKYLVKGGIGTYLGNLTENLQHTVPNSTKII